MVRVLRKKIAVLLLALYWPVLFVLAHIPMPDIVRQAGASDKTLHFLAYMLLAFLLWGTIEPYDKADWRKATPWWLLLVALGYGGADEWLQGYVGRTPDLMDLLADLAGAATTLVLLSFVEFWLAATTIVALAVFTLSCLTRADLTTVLPAANHALHLLGYGVLAALWAHYATLRWPRAPGGWRALARALVGPIGWLAVTQSAAWTLGKKATVEGLLLAGAGIATAVVASRLASRRIQPPG
jgi:VanZ family protein